MYIKFGKLFEELIDNANIVYAYLEMEKTESNFYYKNSERIFETVYKIIIDEIRKDETIKAEMIQKCLFKDEER